MKERKQTFTVDKDTNLLESIFVFKKDLSKKTIKNYIKNKMVSVNNKVVTNSNYLLNNGDIVEICYEKRVIPKYDLDILYEDDYLIAINKPCGLLSISNDKEKDITAYRMVSDYVKSNNKRNFIFVVHRLDQDTSGILMFCKNEKIRDRMQEKWNNIVKKRGYIAVVDGKISGKSTIHSFLMEDKRQFVYSSKNGVGKEAITHYEVIKNNNNYSMLQVFIDTGRRNQIRVHLSENKTPIVGDKKYGSKIKNRLMLHAKTLELIDPRTNKILTITKNPPIEFDKIME